MAFWDDVISFFSGGSSSSSKPSQSSRPETDTRSRSGGGSFGQAQSRDTPRSSYTPAVLSGGGGGGGGGGRGGMVAMSAPVSIRTETPAPTPTPSPSPSPSPGPEPTPPAPKPANAPKEPNIWEKMFGTLGEAQVTKAEGQQALANDVGAWLFEEVHSPEEFFQPVIGSQERVEAKQAAEEEAARPLNLGGSVSGVRELTPEEWGQLSTDQQQAVISNYALYQAAQADSKISDKEFGDDAYSNSVNLLFGEDRGSEKYAPNTVRVLEELGVSNDKLDLDHLLGGQAYIRYGDLFGGAQNEDRQSLVQSYGDAAAFDSQSIQKSLEAGAAILDAVRNSAATSYTSQYAQLAGAASGITDTTELDTVFGNLASRSVMEQAKADQSINDQLTAQIEEVNQKYGPEAVAAYFRQAAGRVTDTVNFMGGDEFINQWIGE